MRSRKVLIVYTLIISLLLLAAAAYYNKSQSSDNGSSDYIGLTDASCAILDKGERDACCAEVHKNDITILCVGSWQLVEGTQTCEFICNGGLPSCPEDLRTCPDGSVIVRNASLDCAFNPCPA